jgi:superfamily II DNA/RNA helicase
MLRKRERESDQSMEKVTTKKKKTEVDDFTAFNISECIQEQLKKKGITSLFEIQKSVFKKIHSQENVIAASLTGSGKTLSFVIPILQGVKDNGGFNKKTPMVLVMAPTRELSIQVGREFSELSSDGFKFKTVMVYGGVSIEEQINNLRGGADVIVGTPGRIIDMIERGNLKLNTIQTVVLDEADKMLTMGFQEQIEDIFKKIYDNKKEVQVCLFSATIQQWVKDIASKIMNRREFTFIDLVKNLENKTPKTVQHLSVQCLKSERVTTIADLSNLLTKFSSLLWR